MHKHRGVTVFRCNPCCVFGVSCQSETGFQHLKQAYTPISQASFYHYKLAALLPIFMISATINFPAF